MLQTPTANPVFLYNMPLFGMIVSMFEQSALLSGVTVPAAVLRAPSTFLFLVAWGTFWRGLGLLLPTPLMIYLGVSILFTDSRADLLSGDLAKRLLFLSTGQSLGRTTFLFGMVLVSCL